MADIAVRRVLLVDNSAVDVSAFGGRRRLHKVLDWYRTTVNGASELLEPVDYVTASDTASGDKVVTGIEFVDEAAVLRANCAGGDVGPGL